MNFPFSLIKSLATNILFYLGKFPNLFKEKSENIKEKAKSNLNIYIPFYEIEIVRSLIFPLEIKIKNIKVE